MSRFQFVADTSTTYPVKRLCQLVEITRSSYYAWRAGAPGRAQRAAADADLAARIRVIHEADLCATLGVTQSMGAVGTSADNALAESFNTTLKREVLQDAACWVDELTCHRQVFRWLTRYNTRRRHSWCSYQSPTSYESLHAATLQPAA